MRWQDSPYYGLSVVARQALERAEWLGIAVNELREREPGCFDYEERRAAPRDLGGSR